MNTKQIKSFLITLCMTLVMLCGLTKNCFADSFTTYMERCEPYRETIERILTEEGVPIEYFALLLAEIKVPLHVGAGNEGGEGKLKEGVDGHSSCIDGCYAGGSHHHHPFRTVFFECLEECGFTGSCLAGKENTYSCVFHKIPGMFQFSILFVHHLILS